MSAEALFEQLKAKPRDLSLRAVYADALQQAGDPRGELLTLETQLGALDPLGDAFWSLKLRRDVLRHDAAADWLDAVLGLKQLRAEPIAWSGFPGTTRERWRWLRALLDQRFDVRTRDVGGDCERAKSVGRALGASVREWICLLDELIAQNAWERVFRDALSLDLVEGQKAFSLMIQGEGDFHWAVPLAKLRAEDPPVVAFSLSERAKWVRSTREGHYGPKPSVTEWARDFIRSYVE